MVLAVEFSGRNARMRIISTALGYLGTPYKYTGTTRAGMDCSGCVYRSALDALHIKLPRRSDAIAAEMKKISDTAVQPGDLLFFKTTNRISHTGVYLGAGKFIHAASEGPRTGVIISDIHESYWKKTYRFAGRFLKVESIFVTESKDIPVTARDEENSPLHPDIEAYILERQ